MNALAHDHVDVACVLIGNAGARLDSMATLDRNMQKRIRATLQRALLKLNAPALAFARLARAAHTRCIAGHWTDLPLFDVNLIDMISSFSMYSA
jgi:hypothetical protein